MSQISPEELLAGSWQHTCLALVMPGGADLPYCRRLNGTGNQLIRSKAYVIINYCICFVAFHKFLHKLVAGQLQINLVRPLRFCNYHRLCGARRGLRWTMCWRLLCQLVH